MNAVEIGPVAPHERTQSAFDIFWIWAGANIVATTLAVGASLASSFPLRDALLLILVGSLAGAALLGSLAPLGPRLGVPSIIAARAALGIRGAGVVAFFMYVANFAWIAVNNVIAASSCAAIFGGRESERAWAFALGIVATLIVAGGPGLVAKTDRIAVPLMLALSLVLTVACLRLPASPDPATGAAGLGVARGLDVVLGYQVSWILMFADYTRYTRSERKSAIAVFFGLGLTSLWLMPLGLLSARAAGTTDPGSMLSAVGLGISGGLLMALGTITTNFVNIYLSALAWRSLVPRTRESVSLWAVGGIGSLLSLLSRAWLERFADFMLLLGGVFTPVGGALLARFFLVRRPVAVEWLYDARGPLSRHHGFAVPGVVAWAAGAALYYFPGDLGGTVPALTGSALSYWLVDKLTAGRA